MFARPLPKDIANLVIEYTADPPCVPINYATAHMLVMEEIYYHDYDYKGDHNMSPSRIKREGVPTGDNIIDAYWEDPNGFETKKHLIEIFKVLQKNGICVAAVLLATGYYKQSYKESILSYRCSHQKRWTTQTTLGRFRLA